MLAAAMAGQSSSLRAQQVVRKPFVIALLPDFMPTWEPWLKIISDGLSALGHIEGRDYVFFRSGVFYGPDYELAVDRALEAKPDMMLVVNLGYAVAAHKVTKTIPIVLLLSGFPVEGGVANSMIRPGKNVTGMTIYAGGEVFGKLVQLVHEVKPGAKRMAALMSYVPPFHTRKEADLIIRGMRGAADSLGIDLRIFEIAKPEQVDAALAAVAAQGLEALILTSGISMTPRRKDILEFATARRLPTIADSAFIVGTERPLLSYSASNPVLMRQAVPYVDQILWRGVKPGDLPIQLPARFEFVVSLKTAKVLGLTVPPSIVVRADEVIE
ncbi:MAG: ABC transporter substrate-binding protein [Ramlibacter sp.]